MYSTKSANIKKKILAEERVWIPARGITPIIISMINFQYVLYNNLQVIVCNTYEILTIEGGQKESHRWDNL